MQTIHFNYDALTVNSRLQITFIRVNVWNGLAMGSNEYFYDTNSMKIRR